MRGGQLHPERRKEIDLPVVLMNLSVASGPSSPAAAAATAAAAAAVTAADDVSAAVEVEL